LRSAVACIHGGNLRLRSPDQMRSVSRSRKLTIIGVPSPYNV
jgi:hypothetical protein